MDTSLPLVQPARLGAEGVHLVFPEVFVTCSGCSREAPDNEHVDSCNAGCCCLTCPTWYACNDCAVKELQAHLAAHPDHIAYCVDAQDELRAREFSSQFSPLKPSLFVFDCFLWPLFKMFVPLMSVLVQVRAVCLLMLAVAGTPCVGTYMTFA